MTHKEWMHLKPYWLSKRYSPWKPIREASKGRRLIKGHAKGVGQVLEKSRIVPTVGLERVFKP